MGFKNAKKSNNITSLIEDLRILGFTIEFFQTGYFAHQMKGGLKCKK